jgi:hypothetical protein
MGKHKFNTLEGIRGFSTGLRNPKVKTEFDIYGSSIYDSARWKEFSKKIRKKYQACQECGERTTYLICDHIKELRDGGEAFNQSNIQVLCSVCHGKKTHSSKVQRKWDKTRAEIEAVLGGSQGTFSTQGGRVKDK